MENLSSVESDWQAAAVWREPCDSFTTPSSLGGIRLWPRLESRAASLAVVVHSRLWLCIAGWAVHGTGLGGGLLARLRAAGGSTSGAVFRTMPKLLFISSRRSWINPSYPMYLSVCPFITASRGGEVPQSHGKSQQTAWEHRGAVKRQGLSVWW